MADKEFWMDDPSEKIDIMEMDVEIDGEKYSANVQNDLKIDRSRVERECQEHSELFAFYSMLYRMAEREYRNKENELETWMSQIDRELRILDNDPDEEFSYSTETELKNHIKSTEKYHEKKNEVLDARHNFKQLKQIVKAFEHRRNMLITLEKRNREDREYERQMEMRKKSD